LILLGIGYLTSYYYSKFVMGTEYILGIDQGIFYLFFVPLLYFMVHFFFGKPAFGKHKDAIIFFLFALLRILFDYIFYDKPIIKDLLFALIGTSILLIMIKFLYKDKGNITTSIE